MGEGKGAGTWRRGRRRQSHEGRERRDREGQKESKAGLEHVGMGEGVEGGYQDVYPPHPQATAVDDTRCC